MRAAAHKRFLLVNCKTGIGCTFSIIPDYDAARPRKKIKRQMLVVDENDGECDDCMDFSCNEPGTVSGLVASCCK